ncbi:CheR family methyltransferase [Pseudomonas sp. 10B1]|uniref:CheR family methyltransferase n=1 Tax=unclassified Pseudomonas TaxID=196821 RepID=UPI002AB5B59B|nr:MULTISPECIES: CheR family methyltransferase [unclassified Pseudomonas]MDY7559293.1 CheR family methyltransferase [Pseudomonas sp. AB6]MEA9979346.1 CheR family methyltransferase [Pseudomonas sp. RTS4]MEA9994113.1 CheR family methyltransferase [Pseudomonas sp. AA4]MEB0086252.1 CheR family methyltransferase [Pseudomonas sp. RTI1]MEB0125040.1 CheR family methyltransferase [Pseudomonas sp. CCC1.2]
MSSDQHFFTFLKNRIGLDVASVGEAIIERAVRQRSILAKSQSIEDYWQLLLTSATEQQALIEAVIVPETWFFRYPESFATLGKLAQARLAELMGVRPLRILSLPCSTGEEPYSIAMALFDTGLMPQQFQIDAVDISPLSIERAQHGIYGKNSFRGEHIEFRDRHFSAKDDSWLISERVQAQVSFQPGNVLDPGLFSAQPAYDFVFCRNLLIYFDLATQQRVFNVLKGWTRVDGVLFIGPAEGNLLARLGMRSIGVAQSFAFSRHADNVPEPVATGVAPPLSRPLTPVTWPSTPRPLVARPSITTLTQRSSIEPAAVDTDAASLLSTIAALANQGRSAEARAGCERFLQLFEPSAQVFYWLGLLSDLGGQRLEAQSLYRKALYLQPQHPEALAQLAALLTSQGDLAGARRLHERATRSLGKDGHKP